MDNRGQFSIIAAMLVAVVLISTVIVTYSTIRNSQIQDHPQVLSAIDETNLAIRQILGFTVDLLFDLLCQRRRCYLPGAPFAFRDGLGDGRHE